MMFPAKKLIWTDHTDRFFAFGQMPVGGKKLGVGEMFEPISQEPKTLGLQTTSHSLALGVSFTMMCDRISSDQI